MDDKHRRYTDAVDAKPEVSEASTTDTSHQRSKRKRYTIEELEEKYQRDCMTFLAELFAFTREAVETFDFPRINGVLVDLYHLYNTTAQFGGYAQVEKTNKWDAVLRNIGIEAQHSNASIAVKAIYQRYLLAFERHNLPLANFGAGEENSIAGANTSTPVRVASHRSSSHSLSSHRSSSNFSHQHYNHHHHLDGDGDSSEIASLRTVVPLDYNEESHFTSLRERAEKNLSCDLRSWSRPTVQSIDNTGRNTKRCGNAFVRHDMRLVDDLYVRFLSALPNEVEFAYSLLIDLFVRRNSSLKSGLGGALPRNTAATSRKQLLSHGFHVIDALLATVGIISDDRSDFAGIYEMLAFNSKLNFVQFWRCNVDDAEISDLLYVSKSTAGEEYADLTNPDDETINNLQLERLLQWEDYACELGRVHQLLAIILSVQNYAANNSNARRGFSQHNGIWKLAFLSSFCHRIVTVRQAGLRLLQTMLCMADLNSLTACNENMYNKWIGDMLTKTISVFIVSPEFELVFESLDLLAHLVRNRQNERFILELVDSLVSPPADDDDDDTLIFACNRENLFERLYNLLMLHDATLTVMTLEVFYHLSSLGVEKICRLLYKTTGLFASLIRLLNVNANMLLRSDRAEKLISFNVNNVAETPQLQQPQHIIAMQPPPAMPTHAAFTVVPQHTTIPAQNLMYFRAPTPIVPVTPLPSSVTAAVLSGGTSSTSVIRQTAQQQSVYSPPIVSSSASKAAPSMPQQQPLVIATGFPPRIMTSSGGNVQMVRAPPAAIVLSPTTSPSPSVMPVASPSVLATATTINSEPPVCQPIPAGTIVCMQKPVSPALTAVNSPVGVVLQPVPLQPVLASSVISAVSATEMVAPAATSTNHAAVENVLTVLSPTAKAAEADETTPVMLTAASDALLSDLSLPSSSQTPTPSSSITSSPVKLRPILSPWPVSETTFADETDDKNDESLEKLINWISSVIVSLDDNSFASSTSNAIEGYNPIEDDVVHVSDVCTLAAIDLHFMPMPSPFSSEEAEILKVFEQCFRRARPSANDSVFVRDSRGRLTTIQRHRLVYDRARMTPDELARLSIVNANALSVSRNSFGQASSSGVIRTSFSSKKRRRSPMGGDRHSRVRSGSTGRLKLRRTKSGIAGGKVLVHASTVAGRSARDAAFLAALEALQPSAVASGEQAEVGSEVVVMGAESSGSIVAADEILTTSMPTGRVDGEEAPTALSSISVTDMPMVVDAVEQTAPAVDVDNNADVRTEHADAVSTPLVNATEITVETLASVAADAAAVQSTNLPSTTTAANQPVDVSSSRLAELLIDPATTTLLPALNAKPSTVTTTIIGQILPTPIRPSTLPSRPVSATESVTTASVVNSPNLASRQLPVKSTTTSKQQVKILTSAAATPFLSTSTLLLSALTSATKQPPQGSSISSGMSKLPLKKHATFIMTPPSGVSAGSGTSSPRSVSRTASVTTPQLFASLTSTTLTSSGMSGGISAAASSCAVLKRPRSALSSSGGEDDQANIKFLPPQVVRPTQLLNKPMQNRKNEQTPTKRLFGTGLPVRTAGAVKNSATAAANADMSFLGKRLVQPTTSNTVAQPSVKPNTLGSFLTNLPKLGSSSSPNNNKTTTLTNLVPVSPSKNMLVKRGQKVRQKLPLSSSAAMDGSAPPTPYIMGGGFSGNLSKKTILVSTRTATSSQLITANVARVLAKPKQPQPQSTTMMKPVVPVKFTTVSEIVAKTDAAAAAAANSAADNNSSKLPSDAVVADVPSKADEIQSDACSMNAATTVENESAGSKPAETVPKAVISSTLLLKPTNSTLQPLPVRTQTSSATPTPRSSNTGLAKLLATPITPTSRPPPPATRLDVFNSLMRRGIIKFRPLQPTTTTAADTTAGVVRKLVMYVREPLAFCEWSDCLRYETNEQSLFWHVVNTHLTEDACDGVCRWLGCSDSGQVMTTAEGITVYHSQIPPAGVSPNACGAVVRGRNSLITHIQDVHCTASTLRARTEENIVSLRENRQRNLPTSAFAATLSPARIMSAVLHQQQAAAAVNSGENFTMQQATQSIHTQFINQTRAYEQAESIKTFLSTQNEVETVVTRAIKLTATLTIKNLLTKAEQVLVGAGPTQAGKNGWALQLKKDLLLHEDELRLAASRTNSDCAPFVGKLLKRLRTTDIGREAAAAGVDGDEEALHACLYAPNVWTSFHELLCFEKDDDAENDTGEKVITGSGGLMKRRDCAVVVNELLNLVRK